MDIFGQQAKRQAVEYRQKIDALNGQIAAQVTHFDERVKEEIQKVRHLIVDDILSIKSTGVTFRGNEYQAYEAAVTEIALKYNAQADWGVLQTGNIIDLRAAFIIGEGLQVGSAIKEGETEPEAEIKFCNDFLDFNDLDREIIQEFAKEAEIEGRILLRLYWEEEFQIPSVRFIPWTEKRYKIITDPQDYLWYQKVTWEAQDTANAKWPAATVPEDEFVYKKFGGRIHDANAAVPKIMKCLTQIENLDKALRDLREINNIFAGPVPDLVCVDSQTATEAKDALANVNFGKIRKIFAHVGEFNYKQPTMTGVASLIAEIEMLAKMISGTTGVPVHYLGLLDLLRNKATGENMYELLYGATSKERQIWRGVYEELIQKAMKMYNAKAGAAKQMSKGKQLDYEKINIDIPTISQEQWDRVEKVFLPAALGNLITHELFLQQIPGIDIKAELERKEEQATDELAQAKEENDALRQQELDKAKLAQEKSNAIR